MDEIWLTIIIAVFAALPVIAFVIGYSKGRESVYKELGI